MQTNGYNIKSKVKSCPFLVKQKYNEETVDWCSRYNGKCSDIKNCEFKK